MSDTKHGHADHRRRRGAPRTGAHEHAADERVPAVAAEPGSGEGAAADSGEPDVTRLAAERDDYLDHLRRLQAEFENYRKRVRRESDELRLRAAEGVVESLLPVVDNMGRALEAAVRHEEGQLVAGLQLVAGQLDDVLAAHGLAEAPAAVGDPFDPTIHEAIMTQPSDDHDEGTVLQILERGYLLHGRLLRPAKVIVAR